MANVTNVFYATRGPALVEDPYSGWEQEVFLGHGNLVTNTTTMLHFADQYFAWYGISTFMAGDIGTPLSQLPAYVGYWSNTGSLPGTNAMHLQDGSGLRIAVIANRRKSSSDDTFATDVGDSIVGAFAQPGFTYPAKFATDNWVDFGAGGGTGTFSSPMSTIDAILPTMQNRGRVKFKPGNTNWTGTISQPVRLDAPVGTVKIGQQ